MDLKASKLELIQAILKVDNASIIEKMANILRKEQGDFWNELSPEQQQEIKKGLAELDEGKRVSYDSFVKKIS
ncbi:MAG TPA: hypothetical protein DEF18_11105 [Muricauda sp.]|uniref:Uncharacterized protein n=1 Tax=Flagellimonas aurea TaxID=2915619 RepID=A0ABS3G6P3_9FLAO|nr:hypothetical protein [Allomuricauda aurea]MAO16641.1 hypothetical protein [Allomuricauda sp.]UBZ12668.1 hypothetical protein LDL77_12285 [Allomuricauda aquimarina]HAI44707.1 hypothetical protein [Maribacter sp.]MBO0354578.1 hypothetical protein [Allomuricauda aurea]HBU78637.1 hypothetical protein [Allomuricauda sp.]|tara:strand:- start:250 stop:468 length:219 start_codon:yes stop_codon:yes gene_type:complete